MAKKNDSALDGGDAGGGAGASVGVDDAVTTPGKAARKADSETAPPLASSPDLPSTGLLSFYDRLRQRILDAVERRGGKLGTGTVRALLLVPDVFMLLVRIALDPEVPGGARAMVGGALAYFVLPIDLMPEAFVGGPGYLDDLVLATAVLAHAFSGELEPYARKHWSGPEDLRKVIGDITGAAQGLLGVNVYERVKKLLARRGVEVKE